MDIDRLFDLATDIANFGVESMSPEPKPAPPGLSDCMHNHGVDAGAALAQDHPAAAAVGSAYLPDHFSESLGRAERECGLPQMPPPPAFSIPSPADHPVQVFFDVALQPSQAGWGEDQALQAMDARASFHAGYEEGTGHAWRDELFGSQLDAHTHIDWGHFEALSERMNQPPAEHVNALDMFQQELDGARSNATSAVADHHGWNTGADSVAAGNGFSDAGGSGSSTGGGGYSGGSDSSGSSGGSAETGDGGGS